MTTWTTLEYRPEPDSVALYGNGTRVRAAVRGAGSVRTCGALAAALNTALREGAAYGPIDHLTELARIILDEPDLPGRVRYDLNRTAQVLTRTEGGTTSTVTVPALRTKSALAEFARELDDAFRTGGDYAAAVEATRTAVAT
jgi:hypothetical protein